MMRAGKYEIFGFESASMRIVIGNRRKKGYVGGHSTFALELQRDQTALHEKSGDIPSKT